METVRPELFITPYSDIIKLIQRGEVSIETIIEQIGLTPVQASLDAVKNINGLGDSNWVSILEKTALAYDAGNKLEKFARRLQQGEIVDWTNVEILARRATENIGGEFSPLSLVEPCEIPLKTTGFTALDEHLGGLPIVGQVIVAAPPGTGKTTFMVQLAGYYAHYHPDENVAIFTLEMMKSEIALRFKECMPHLTKKTMQQIQVNDAILTPEEVISKAASVDHLGLVCIDFADLLIRGETTESTMAHIYRTFMLGSKQVGCPVVLLSQLNREYTGGIPRPNNIRYTGLAEALGWMILMLYNPATDYFAEEDCDDVLPIQEGYAYIICWKMRGGFRKHRDDSPGAIQLRFKGNRGWNCEDKGRWHSLKKL